jgi:ubiquinone/menaquinone biosynthesis C-methylase UbiE
MVGNERRTGRGAADLTVEPELTAGLRAGYEAAAPAWADGPGPLYTQLAQVLVAAAPVPLAGAVVLDLGAGTGAAGWVALAAGARQVVAADLSLGMLRQARDRGAPAPASTAAWDPVAADAVALPFRDHGFDLVLAAFCLNHLNSLAAGLAEARRVGAAIAASTFAPGWDHPAKGAVDKVLRSFGYQPPAWYACLSPGSRAGDPAALAEHAAAAGFTDVQVRTADVRTALVTAAELASWRLGLAQVAPFLRSLARSDRAAVRHAAERAVAEAIGRSNGTDAAASLVVSIVILTAS